MKIAQLRMLFLLAIASLLSLSSFSQDSTQAKVKMEFLNGYWLLDITTDNKTAMRAMPASDASFGSKTKGIKQLEAYFKDYVSESLTLWIDSQEVQLNFVRLELSSAKSYCQFISPRFDSPGSEVIIKANTYAALRKHVNTITVINGEERTSKRLTLNNDFTTKITCVSE